MTLEEFEEEKLKRQAEIGKIVMVSILGGISPLQIIEVGVKPKMDEYIKWADENDPTPKNVVRLK